MTQSINKTQIFDFNDNLVETINIDGITLYNVLDVAKYLDIKDAHARNIAAKMPITQAIRVTNKQIESNSFRKLNNRGENFLTESGVYEMIFNSRKPAARKFVNWVCNEVLPQIRKTGAYVMKNREQEYIDYLFPNANPKEKNMWGIALKENRDKIEKEKQLKKEILLNL